MKCPVCSHSDHNEIDLHSDGYAEGIIECTVCGTLWLDKHGLADIINIPNELPTGRAL